MFIINNLLMDYYIILIVASFVPQSPTLGCRSVCFMFGARRGLLYQNSRSKVTLKYEQNSPVLLLSSALLSFFCDGGEVINALKGRHPAFSAHFVFPFFMRSASDVYVLLFSSFHLEP